MAEYRKSYSQVGEDLLIAFFLQKEKEVSYIDIGCLWPTRLSNTYFFYQRGGQGLCIDPNPDIRAEYEATRPRDTFLNLGIGAREGSLTYHRFQNPVFNTFLPERAARLAATGRPGRNPIGSVEIAVRPLSAVLRELDWRPRFGPRVDVLSMDVEGLEMDVLSSIDFTYVRPRLIVLETAVTERSPEANPCIALLREQGYQLSGWTGHDAFMMDRNPGAAGAP
jgi:FkbM family methyltransferase